MHRSASPIPALRACGRGDDAISELARTAPIVFAEPDPGVHADEVLTAIGGR